MTSKDESYSIKLLQQETENSMGFRSRASSESARSDKFAIPSSNDAERLTPVDVDDDRMSVSSSITNVKCTILKNSQKFDGFEKECSYESNPSHMENKLDLAMVPVISDQLLYDIVNKERTIEQIDVHLFVKKSLDLLSAKNAAELKIEQLKQRNAELELENRNIRESKVKMQVRVEQEEEYISNMLLKRIQKLKTDKEMLALKYEQEEEFLTNDLMRKLLQLEGERDELATRLSKDQSWVVNNLLVKIRKLEAEIQNNHKSLEQLRREKVDLENSLEHEQEALFNKIGKRMDQLEAEKRRLQTRLDEMESNRLPLTKNVLDGNGTGNDNFDSLPSTSSSLTSSLNLTAPLVHLSGLVTEISSRSSSSGISSSRASLFSGSAVSIGPENLFSGTGNNRTVTSKIFTPCSSLDISTTSSNRGSLTSGVGLIGELTSSTSISGINSGNINNSSDVKIVLNAKNKNKKKF